MNVRRIPLHCNSTPVILPFQFYPYYNSFNFIWHKLCLWSIGIILGTPWVTINVFKYFGFSDWLLFHTFADAASTKNGLPWRGHFSYSFRWLIVPQKLSWAYSFGFFGSVKFPTLIFWIRDTRLLPEAVHAA